MKKLIGMALCGLALCTGCSVLGVKVNSADLATIAACAAEVDKASQAVVDSVPACKALPGVAGSLTK